MDPVEIITNTIRRRQQKGCSRVIGQLKAWNDTITISSAPSQVVAVGNAGLACGFSSSDVTANVVRLITGDCTTSDNYTDNCEEISVDVLMVLDKSFALVIFKHLADAVKCHEAIVGHIFRASNGQKMLWFPVFISEHKYESLPDVESRKHPPGLLYIPDIISADNERALVAFVDVELANNLTSKNSLKNRTALHYGYQFRYGSNDIDISNPVQPIPSILAPVIKQLMDQGCMDQCPDQLTINIYEPGQGIPPHIDTHSAFEDGIVSLSIGSAVVMDFCCDSINLPVLLQPRSAVSMRGASRYAWTHGIAPRSTDCLPGCVRPWRRSRRISFTFRRIRHQPCQCNYPQFCDNPQNRSYGACVETIPKRDSALPENVEETHVYQVYEDIAPHFSQTRYKPWPRVVHFLQSLESGAVLGDVGCGNGKYLGLRKDLFQVGCDRSSNLIDICRDRRLEVLVSDILTLPFRDGCCDAVICIAVIHHLSTQERRFEALRELVRSLVIGGRGLVYVWALEQKKDQKVSTYLKGGKISTTCEDRCDEREQTDNDLFDVTGTCSPSADAGLMPVHTNRTEFKQQDLLVPWHLKGKQEKESGDNKDAEKVFHRYYHVFREKELRECCERIENIDIIEEYYDEGNWCIIFRKVR